MDNPISNEIKLYQEKNRALSLPSDEEICNQFVLKKGNVKAVAKEFGCSVRYVNSRLGTNPAIKESQELGRAITTQDLHDDIYNAVKTGYISYYQEQPDGTFKRELVKIDTGTRMFHMTKLVDMTKKHIGIVKKEEPVNAKNNITFNVLTNESLQAIEQILKDNL